MKEPPVYKVIGAKAPKKGTKAYNNYLAWLIEQLEFLNNEKYCKNNL